MPRRYTMILRGVVFHPLTDQWLMPLPVLSEGILPVAEDPQSRHIGAPADNPQGLLTPLMAGSYLDRHFQQKAEEADRAIVAAVQKFLDRGEEMADVVREEGKYRSAGNFIRNMLHGDWQGARQALANFEAFERFGQTTEQLDLTREYSELEKLMARDYMSNHACVQCGDAAEEVTITDTETSV